MERVPKGIREGLPEGKAMVPGPGRGSLAEFPWQGEEMRQGRRAARNEAG